MYLHSNGIVFCDLKPTNIILNEYSSLKICDFAVAQKIIDMVQNIEENQNKKGAPNYMAPELFEKEGVYSFSSDIYAMGCILYEQAKGTPPFYSDKFQELANKICNENYQPVEGYSAEFNSFLSILLQKNPAKRAKWGEIVKHHWFGNHKIALLDIPKEPHFEEYLAFKNLNNFEGENKDFSKTTQNLGRTGNSEKNPNFAQTSDLVNRMQSEKVKGKGAANDANLIRLSLNVKKNICKENSDYLGIIDNKDVKLKNIDEVIDMGENNLESNIDQENIKKDNTEWEEEEDFMKSMNNDNKSLKGSNLQNSTRSGYKDKIDEKKMNMSHTSKQTSKTDRNTKQKEISNNKSNKSIQSSKLPGNNETTLKDFQGLQPYLFHQTDRVVKPIMGNPEIEKLDEFPFYHDLTNDFHFLSIDEFKKLDKDGFENYLTSLYKYAVAQCPMKEKLNILHYFIRFIQSSENANIIIESFFMDLFLKMLKLAKTQSFKIALCTIIGLLLRHTTVVNNDIAKQGIAAIMIDLLKDENYKVFKSYKKIDHKNP